MRTLYKCHGVLLGGELQDSTSLYHRRQESVVGVVFNGVATQVVKQFVSERLNPRSTERNLQPFDLLLKQVEFVLTVEECPTEDRVQKKGSGLKACGTLPSL